MNEETMVDDLLAASHVLTVKPGEALIFKFDRDLTPALAAQIREQIASGLPPDMPFLVVGAAVEIKVGQNAIPAAAPSASRWHCGGDGHDRRH